MYVSLSSCYILFRLSGFSNMSPYRADTVRCVVLLPCVHNKYDRNEKVVFWRLYMPLAYCLYNYGIFEKPVLPHVLPGADRFIRKYRVQNYGTISSIIDCISQYFRHEFIYFPLFCIDYISQYSMHYTDAFSIHNKTRRKSGGPVLCITGTCICNRHQVLWSRHIFSL